MGIFGIGAGKHNLVFLYLHLFYQSYFPLQLIFQPQVTLEKSIIGRG